MATGQHRGALLDRIASEVLHRGQAPGVGQRPHLGAGGQAVAHLQALGMRGQRGGEFLVNALVHQKAGGGDAHLACVAELGRTRRLHRQRNVGVFAHDYRRVPAQLHGHAFHVLARQGSQLLAHRRGAGEGQFADHRVRHKIA